MDISSTHHQLSDDHFLDSFFDLSFAPESFSHEAHFRLAWLCLDRFPLLEAKSKVCRGIQRYDRTHGDGTKYHETLTCGLLLLVYEHKVGNPVAGWEAFLSAHPDLMQNWRQYLLQYYQEATLFSHEAGKSFVLPDKGF